MDTLTAMHAFIRVVELGSLSRAATDLGVGQPAVTKWVAQLERTVGSRLLHRSSQGVTVTEIGARYLEQCRLIAHQVEEAHNLARQMQSELQGSLRVSTSVAFGRRVLAPLVLRFLREHPKMQIDLSCEDRYVDLRAQGVDVAVRMGRLADSELGARHLGFNPWVVVASSGYLASRGTPLTPQDLGQHDALVYSTVQGDARWTFNPASPGATSESPSQTVLVQGPLRSNNLSALLMAAREGLGVAALPWYVAHESVRAGTVQPVLQDWMLPSQEIHAVYPSPRMMPTKARVFVSWLQGQFGEAWWARPLTGASGGAGD